MSIIKFSVKTVSGALNPVNGDAGEIGVSKNEKAKVVMTGYVGAPRVQQADGTYKSSAFGRLPVQAAITGEGDKKRYVIEIAGGLRGVLFPAKNKKDEKSPDYTGNIDLGDGTEMALFGRKVSSESGNFISLSSGEAKAKEDHGNGGKTAASHESFESDSDIPF